MRALSPLALRDRYAGVRDQLQVQEKSLRLDRHGPIPLGPEDFVSH
jgi:hypothetical protein